MPTSFHIGFSYDGQKADGTTESVEQRAVLQAPRPASGVITTTSGGGPAHHSVAQYTRPTRPPPPSAPRTLETLSAGKKRDPPPQSDLSPPRRRSVGSYFAALPEMVLCFCCCPTYKCALWGCMFELIVSLFCWYKILGLVLSSFHHLDLGDALLIFILTFWIVTLFTSFGMLVASHKRKNASYALPRLIQQSGLLIVSLITMALLFVYFFGGGAPTINSWSLRLYTLFTGHELTAAEEQELGKDVRMIALVIVPIDFFFVCYFAVGLWITRRYYNQTKSKYGSGFHPVSQTEPTAPAAVPPPTNPYYKGPVY